MNDDQAYGCSNLEAKVEMLEGQIMDLKAKLAKSSEDLRITANDRYLAGAKAVHLKLIASIFVASFVLQHGLRRARSHFMELARLAKVELFDLSSEQFNEVLAQGAQMATSIEREEIRQSAKKVESTVTGIAISRKDFVRLMAEFAEEDILSDPSKTPLQTPSDGLL